MRIGLVGCGAIGSSLADFIRKKLKSAASLTYILDIDPKQEDRLRRALKIRSPKLTLTQLVQKSDLVIEAASIRSAREIVPLAIRFKKPVLLMSGGGLIQDPSLLKRIFKNASKFYLPSGAVGSIDGLLASREAGLIKVRLTTSKSLKSLRGAPFFEKFPAKQRFKKGHETIFKGNVLDAVRLFPKNLNVAALLALAGLGAKRTQVRVVAYKKLRKNIHEVEVTSRAGKMTFKTENFPHPENPRTSALAIYSAQALLRKILAPLSLGT